MSVCYQRNENQHILYDSEVLEHATPELFEPTARERGEGAASPVGGRGAAFFIGVGERRLVLRHYRRGGMLGHLLGDQYAWMGLAHTRVWREWHLLAQMYQEGLPVPRPVAGRVQRHGLLYRGDLITAALPEAVSLAGRLAQQPLTAREWRLVGRCIRRFHQRGIQHPDLNAHNILLDDKGGVFLIDFDKGSLQTPGSRQWQNANLARLRRSLGKLAGEGQIPHFRAGNWDALVEGYRAGPTLIGPAATA